MSPISKFCHEHPKIVTKIKSPTFTYHQHLCGPSKRHITRPWYLLIYLAKRRCMNRALPTCNHLQPSLSVDWLHCWTPSLPVLQDEHPNLWWDLINKLIKYDNIIKYIDIILIEINSSNTDVGALFLLGEDRRIHILGPDMSKNKAPASVESFELTIKNVHLRLNIIIYITGALSFLWSLDFINILTVWDYLRSFLVKFKWNWIESVLLICFDKFAMFNVNWFILHCVFA